MKEQRQEFHFFSTDHACKYGIEEAILIAHLTFWIRKNQACEKHQHQAPGLGLRTWTYGSAQHLARIFPYIPPRKIRAIIASLVRQGVIITGDHNQSSWDRTTWYAFTAEQQFCDGEGEVQKSSTRCTENCQLDGPKSVHRGTENGTSKDQNLYITRDIVQDTRTDTKIRDFAEFPAPLDNEEFRATWASWLDDRRSRRKPVTKHAQKLQLTKLAQWGSAKAIESIKNSITNGWQGLFPSNENHTTTRAQNNGRNSANRNSATLNDPAQVNWDELASKSCLDVNAKLGSPAPGISSAE